MKDNLFDALIHSFYQDLIFSIGCGHRLNEKQKEKLIKIINGFMEES